MSKKIFVAKRIFISYGHDESASLALRICGDLKKRGHEVWLDIERLKPGYDWQLRIEEAIDWLTVDKHNSVMLLLMTPHSVRRPKGFCLNEVSYASRNDLTIIPVMVVESEPPLCIYHLQWLDMQSCIPISEKEKFYKPCLKRLLEALEDKSKLDFEGSQYILKNVLNPISFSADIIRLLKDFTGRKWVFEEIDNWFKEKSNRKVFWITGNPGVGKSAISAWIRDNRQEISAFHFCDYNSEEKRDPMKLVLSIAYQLSTQLYEYQLRLVKLDLKKIISEYREAYTLFNKLVIEPFSNNFPEPDRTIVILVDALDEASNNQENEIAKFIRLSAEKTPQWMKFLITSRPEPFILSYFQKYEQYNLDDRTENNMDDFRVYVKNQIPIITQRQIHSILEHSEGLFLYVKYVCEEINNGRLSLEHPDKFPKSLGDIYRTFFERQFKNALPFYKEEIRPLLYPIIATYEPLTFDFFNRYGGFKHKNKLFDLVDRLGSLLIKSGDDGRDTIRLFHRSVYDWIIDKNSSDPYYIDVQYGHEVLCEYGWNLFISGKLFSDNYFLHYLADHCIVAKDWEKLAIIVTDVTFFEVYYKESKKHELMRYWRQLISHINPTEAFKSSINKLLAKGIDNQKLFLFLSEITQLLRDMGFGKDALPFAIQSLSILKEIVEPDSEQVAQAYREIADVYRTIEDFDNAFKNYNEALKIYEQKFGENSAQVATIYYHFAMYYRDQKNYSEAIKYNKKTLLIRERVIPCDIPALADTINDTGVLINESLASKDKSSSKEDILPYYERALELFKKFYVDKHFDIATVLGNIGQYHLEWKDDVEFALKYFSEAYSMMSLYRVSHHPQVCSLRGYIVKCLERLERFKDAISLQKEQIICSQIRFPSGSISILEDRNKLLILYEKVSERKEIISLKLENFYDYKIYYPDLSDFYKKQFKDYLEGGHYREQLKDVIAVQYSENSYDDLSENMKELIATQNINLYIEDQTNQLLLAIRDLAHDCIETQKYVEAEDIYFYLLDNCYARASNHCHLARLYFIIGKEKESRNHIKEASKYESEAPVYIQQRLLFFKILFNLLDGKGVSQWILQINELLVSKSHNLSWTIQPVLDLVNHRLSNIDIELINKLAEEINKVE